MILLYHLTGGRRYVDSLIRVGQWILDARLDGSVRGWADWYHKDNEPAWAREFEPPAYSGRATISATRALVEIYRLSGAKKYLKPLGTCLIWLKKEYPDGMYFFDDHKTGRPITARQYKIVYLDKEAVRDWIRKQPLSSGYYSNSNIIPVIEKILANTERSANRMPEFTIEEIKNRLTQLRNAAARAPAEQNEVGFRTPGSDAASYSMKPVLPTTSVRVIGILRYIEVVRMVIGEFSLKWRGDGKFDLDIYPKENWYDVG